MEEIDQFVKLNQLKAHGKRSFSLRVSGGHPKIVGAL
jgi:hypothetical protein